MRISVMVTHLAHNQVFTFESWFATKGGEGKIFSLFYLKSFVRQVACQVKPSNQLIYNNVSSSDASTK